MKFNKVVIEDKQFGPDYDDVSWYCGIYKIVLYTDSSVNKGKDIYCAYYKPDGWKNWGNRVNPRVEFYTTLKDAVRACERHAAIKEAAYPANSR